MQCCAARRNRAACSKTSSSHLDHLESLLSHFQLLFNDGPEAQADCTACIYCLVLYSAVRVV
jgi:hypothetical protein